MTLLKDMPGDARLWVYQSNKALSDDEVNSIRRNGEEFISEWAAHGASLKAAFDVMYNRFIVVAVDERQALASGCSIDKSVKFMKELEVNYNLDLFDRMQVAYRNGDEIVACRLTEFEKRAGEGLVNDSTIVFNNMVITKAAFDSEWEVPLKKSWQSRVLAS